MSSAPRLVLLRGVLGTFTSPGRRPLHGDAWAVDPLAPLPRGLTTNPASQPAEPRSKSRTLPAPSHPAKK